MSQEIETMMNLSKAFNETGQLSERIIDQCRKASLFFADSSLKMRTI
jgi:hypothetical protein